MMTKNLPKPYYVSEILAGGATHENDATKFGAM
jgi:hypothetical protein